MSTTHPYRDPVAAPKKPEPPTGDLAIWDIRHNGSTPVEIKSQNPAEAPKDCPTCGKPMTDNYIGCNSYAHFYIRTCPDHPYVGWNASRYD